MMSAMLVLLGALAHGQDYDDHMRQARFFTDKGWTEDALRALDQAVQTEEGQRSAEAWFLLASLHLGQARYATALHAARQAHAHAASDGERADTADLLQFLEGQFGTVRLESPRKASVQLDLTLETTLFDPALKSYVAQLLQRLDAERAPLPTVMGLPAGSYTINGTFVHVDPGSEATFDPTLNRTTRARRAYLSLGIGAAQWFATGLSPALSSEVALEIPMGAVFVGPVVQWNPQPFTAGEQTQWSAESIAGGLRLGVDVTGPSRWVVRPAAEVRVGRLGGLRFGCRQTPDLVCTYGADREPFLHAGATVAVGTLEVAVMRRSLGAVSLGAKAAGDLASVWIPATGEGRDAQGLPQPYTNTRRQFSAPGLRALVVMSVAL